MEIHICAKYGRLISNQNKRPMGHIAYLRKQFNSITHMIIIIIIERRKNPLFTL